MKRFLCAAILTFLLFQQANAAEPKQSEETFSTFMKIFNAEAKYEYIKTYKASAGDIKAYASSNTTQFIQEDNSVKCTVTCYLKDPINKVRIMLYQKLFIKEKKEINVIFKMVGRNSIIAIDQNDNKCDNKELQGNQMIEKFIMIAGNICSFQNQDIETRKVLFNEELIISVSHIIYTVQGIEDVYNVMTKNTK